MRPRDPKKKPVLARNGKRDNFQHISTQVKTRESEGRQMTTRESMGESRER